MPGVRQALASVRECSCVDARMGRVVALVRFPVVCPCVYLACLVSVSSRNVSILLRPRVTSRVVSSGRLHVVLSFVYHVLPDIMSSCRVFMSCFGAAFFASLLEFLLSCRCLMILARCSSSESKTCTLRTLASLAS